MYDEKSMLWEWLLEDVGVSEETLQVVTTINGYSVETLNDILYAVTGYRSKAQYEGEDECYYR